MFLLGVKYSPQKNLAVMQFLDDNKLVVIDDPTGHKPYMYTDQFLQAWDKRIKEITSQTLFDRILQKDVTLRKIIVDNPLIIGDLRDEVLPNWESNVKYHWLYICDRGLIPSIDYNTDMTPIIKQISDDSWENLLGQPMPEIPMIAVDIEVQAPGIIPDAELAEYPIASVALVTDKGKRIVYINKELRDYAELDMPDTMVIFQPEEMMIKTVCSTLCSFPVVLSFNGYNFDLSYLYHRGLYHYSLNRFDLGLERHQYGIGMIEGIHIDLFMYFSNLTIQNYVYGAKYKYHNLDNIASCLLGRHKKGEGGRIAELSSKELAEYNLEDADITMALAMNKNRELMRVLMTLSRITKLPIEDICLWGTNKWVYSWLLWEHKKFDYLVPNREQLGERNAETVSIIKGKKYKGAKVFEPVPGLHFGVKALDAASLYPTIVSRYNLSYETICCTHKECEVNKIPETSYWYCGKVKGVISSTIGNLRDFRVNKVKALAKKDDFWKAVSQGVKTIMNATYGVAGFKKFPLYYVPMAESVTAIGRHIMEDIDRECRGDEYTIIPLYGDTDSIFIQGDNTDIEKIQRYALEKHQVELEVDKDLVWLALTDRKKNYLGLLTDGSMVIRGLQGKKIHTPPFMADTFTQMVDILKAKLKENDLNPAKESLRELISANLKTCLAFGYPINSYTFKMIMKHEIAEYKTTTEVRVANEGLDLADEDLLDDTNSHIEVREHKLPQHIRAAVESGEELTIGKVITFVKTKDGPKPPNKANVEDLDLEAYVDIYQSSLEQVLEALGFDFYELAGIRTIEGY